MDNMLAIYKQGQWTWSRMPAAAFRYRILEVANPEPGKTYPLIFHMHSFGAQGTDNRRTFYALADTYLFDPRTLGQRNPAWKAYVFVPQIPDERMPPVWRWCYQPSGSPAEPDSWPSEAIPAMVDFLAQRYPVDRDRIYATGLSMGACGVWDAMVRNQDVFAAGVPLAGYGQRARGDAMLKMPIWALHAVGDRAVLIDGSPAAGSPYVGSRSIMRELSRLGSDVLFTEPATAGGARTLPDLARRHVLTAYTITENPNDAHDIAHQAFNERQLPVWLFAQSRAGLVRQDAGVSGAPDAGADAGPGPSPAPVDAGDASASLPADAVAAPSPPAIPDPDPAPSSPGAADDVQGGCSCLFASSRGVGPLHAGVVVVLGALLTRRRRSRADGRARIHAGT